MSNHRYHGDSISPDKTGMGFALTSDEHGGPNKLTEPLGAPHLSKLFNTDFATRDRLARGGVAKIRKVKSNEEV